MISWENFPVQIPISRGFLQNPIGKSQPTTKRCSGGTLGGDPGYGWHREGLGTGTRHSAGPRGEVVWKKRMKILIILKVCFWRFVCFSLKAIKSVFPPASTPGVFHGFSMLFLGFSLDRGGCVGASIQWPPSPQFRRLERGGAPRQCLLQLRCGRHRPQRQVRGTAHLIYTCQGGDREETSKIFTDGP